MKALKFVFRTIILLAILIVIYLATFQISSKRLLIKDTTKVVALNNLNSKEVQDLLDFYKNNVDDQDKKDDVEKYKKYIRLLKGADLISFNENISKDNEYKDKDVIVVNFGVAYPIAKFNQNKFFDKLGDNYFSLKKEYQDKLEKDYDIDKKVYMTNYRGYYFLSDDTMKLSQYLSLLLEKKTNEKMVEKLDRDAVVETLISLDKGYYKDLDLVKVTLDYKKENLVVNTSIFGDLDFSEYLKPLKEKDRRYDKYIGNDKIYVNVQDFKKLTEFLKEEINPDIKKQLSVVKMFTGKEIEDFTDQIDGEIIYDYKKEQLILPLKDTSDYERILGIFTEKKGNTYTLVNGKKIKIEDKTIFYNGDMKEENGKVAKDVFASGIINLSLYNQKLDGIYIRLDARAKKGELNLKATTDEKGLQEIYKKMEEAEND